MSVLYVFKTYFLNHFRNIITMSKDMKRKHHFTLILSFSIINLHLLSKNFRVVAKLPEWQTPQNLQRNIGLLETKTAHSYRNRQNTYCYFIHVTVTITTDNTLNGVVELIYIWQNGVLRRLAKVVARYFVS